MFGKLMSGLGLDAIKVDTILYNPSLQAGETLTGEIYFKGGSSDKKINGLSLKLMTTAEVVGHDHEYMTELCIDYWQISDAFELSAHQEHRIPFSVQLPFDTPLTELPAPYNTTQVWIYTHLDVDWGLDAKDNDYLQILPTPAMTIFIEAMQQCGFHLSRVDVEKGQIQASNFHSSIDCYQELEFKQTGFFNSVNEVEISFIAEPSHTHVMLETNKRFGSDQLLTLTLDNSYLDVNQITNEIKQLLNP